MERATATSCKYAFLLSEGKKKSKEPELFLALLQEKLESCGLGVEKKEIHVDKEGNATKASKSVRTVTGLVVWAPFQVLAKEAEKEGFGKIVQKHDDFEDDLHLQSQHQRHLGDKQAPTSLSDYYDIAEFTISGAEKGKFGAYSPNDSSFFAPHEQFSIILDLSSSVLKVDIEGETKIKLIDHKGVVLRGFITALPLHLENEKNKIWGHYRPNLKTIAPWNWIQDDQIPGLPGPAGIHYIRRYYGEKVAFYFAWLHTFTSFLLLPAAMGGGMWGYARFYGLTVDDNSYLPFYGIIMVIWSFLLLKKWQRTCAEYAYSWGTLEVDDEPEFELVRPTYHGEIRISPVTHLPEIHYPDWKRLRHYLVSFVVTFLLLVVTAFVMVCSFNLQGYMSDKESAFHVELLHQFSEPGAIFDPNGPLLPIPFSLLPVLIHVICIMSFNQYYSGVALWLTELENHRSQSQFEASLVLKRFLFEAFDCYLPLFYLAFYELDARLLKKELSALYTTDSIRRVITETAIPLILLSTTSISRAIRRITPKKTPKTEDLIVSERIIRDLQKGEYEIFNDYLEMVIGLGYITLFASAFPLASLLSYICNSLELRSDIFKLVYVTRKPHSERRATIGVWYYVQLGMAWLSILTNCLIFGFSSEQMVIWFPWLFTTEDDMPKEIVYEGGKIHRESSELFTEGLGRYAVGIVFCLEHFVILIAVGIILLFPSEPRWVTDKRLRKSYLSRTVLRKQQSLTGTVGLTGHVDGSEEEGRGLNHHFVRGTTEQQKEPAPQEEEGLRKRKGKNVLLES